MGLRNPLPIAEQVIVITGASSGIGRAAALMFADRGARLVLAARNEEALQAVAEEARERGGSAIVLPTDVSVREQVNHLAEETIRLFGRIDTWVNDAAVSEYVLIADQDPEEIEHIVRVNLLGTIYGCQAALRAGMRTRGGTIINIGSVLSERSIPLQGVYCATKHGVKGFTEVLRMELEREEAPVNVTLIKPAVINTPFYRNARSQMGYRPQPTKPIYEPEVVAEAIVGAAERSLRDVFAGGAGVMLAVMEHFAGALTDRFMVRTNIYFDGQLSDKPDDGTSNLFTPSPGKGSVSGGYASHFAVSPYTRYLEMHPKAKRTVFATALLLGVAAIAARSSKG